MPARFTIVTISSLLDREGLKRIRVALSPSRPRLLLVLGVVLLGTLSLAAPALAVSTVVQATGAAKAATSEGSTDPGVNLVTWLSGWVGGLFALTIGGAGIAVAARRNVGEGLALLLVAVMVGGFVIDPSDMNIFTTAIWHKLATGA
jgi:hypothetical protein